MKKLVEKSLLGQAWVMEHIIDFGETTNFADALVKNILAGRGLVGDAEIEMFLAPTIKEYMPDPFVLNDMERAAKIIAEAICSHRKIAVYGDYDVDGITSTAIFVKFLRSLNVDVIWHVPTRDGEGYGLNTGAIDELINSGATVLVTVDCGISCVAEVEYAKSHGLTVVVTDHHSPDSVLPNADAVVNPKRVDDTSGLDYLAGVGVAFLTLVAVNRELRNCSNGTVCELQSQINLMLLIQTLTEVLHLKSLACLVPMKQHLKKRIL